MRHKGSCHCGKVAFEVNVNTSSNCMPSLRSTRQLCLLTADADIGTYTFNKHVVKHRFCRTCGIHPYGEGSDPQGNRMAAINIRCLEGIDLEKIPVQHFDGRSL
ncbi:MAG TPA: GFA family protein [Verrucomicrobiae bacterium]|nr:GFA family protein [Verrucomicrobiae bacterium]